MAGLDGGAIAAGTATEMGGQGFSEFPSLAGIRILLVDDESDARELLEIVLRYADGDVVSVASAPAALDALETAAPDILLVDLMMPGHDGYWLLEQIRGTAGRRRVPAVAITGHTRSHDRLRAMRSGFEAYLAKPVDPIELCRLVRDLTQRA